MSEHNLTRRNFLQWSAAAAGLAGLVGLSATETAVAEEAMMEPAIVETGEWHTGGCINNCNCGSARCLLRVYVEDGVPLKIRTDEDEEDTFENPQRRACGRGRAQISNITSPARIKYPMKRKNWSPDEPNGELRGLDEWERIEWDEALDYIAAEIQKTYDTYGHQAVLSCGYDDIGDTYFDQNICLYNAMGGIVHHGFGTVSMGSWPVVEMLMMGTFYDSPDVLTVSKADLLLHFGNNWASNKAGNYPFWVNSMRERGTKVIIVDIWNSQTAQVCADEWVPVHPGTDIAFVLGMAYHQIENNLQNQDFLDKYCIGFDAEHMPEDANPEDNFKDYVLGTYDGEPKTPEWAEAISGVPAAKIREIAQLVADTPNVNFFAGQSTTKFPAGETFAQVFYTFALMHGVGYDGNSVAWTGMREGMSGMPFVTAGDSSNGFGLNPVNPNNPPTIFVQPDWSQIEDQDSWQYLDYTEGWRSILQGYQGRESWPGGLKPVDIHHIYAGGYGNSLNQNPDTNSAIKVFRNMDFVWGANPYFDPTRQYCDIVVPVTTWWEHGNKAFANSSDVLYYAEAFMDPLYESKDYGWIAEQLAERLGIDPKAVNTMTDAERSYVSIANAMALQDDMGTYAPLVSLTEEDLAEIGVQAGDVESGESEGYGALPGAAAAAVAAIQPQDGIIPFSELKEKGFYKVRREMDDALMHNPFSAFIADPENNPLGTATGKFEIYSPALAATINSTGYNTIEPIGKYQVGDPEQGWGQQTDEYPLLLWTPHSLRRAHSVNDNVTSLREAWPQECYMSTVDAEARGIANGDIVLMSSPHGQVLRPAKVLPTIVPGCVALQDGGWLRIDPETGIDLGGCPNVLQAMKASGQGSQSWTGTLLQVEKYTGDLELVPDKDCPLVMPVGVDA